MPWENKTGLAKAAVFFAVLALVSAGLCGLNIGAVFALERFSWPSGVLIMTAYVETIGIGVGLIGLVVVMLAALVMKIADFVRGRKS
jgi:Ni,Fe-hydrogenase I cytochrome b subunit